MKTGVRILCSDKYTTVFTTTVLLLALAELFTGCGGGAEGSQSGVQAPHVTSVAITSPSTSLIVGQSQQLSATASYSDGTSADLTTTALWSSQDSTVATVSASGLMTAIGAGQATLVAIVSSVKGSATIAISAKKITALSIAQIKQLFSLMHLSSLTLLQRSMTAPFRTSQTLHHGSRRIPLTLRQLVMES